MKCKMPLLLLTSVLLTSGCGGGADSVTTEQFSQNDNPVNNVPVVKWVTQDIDLDDIGENQSVSIPFNIVDPDSSEFQVSARLVGQPNVPLFVNGQTRVVNFTTPFIQGDIADQLEITVVDETGLEGVDSIDFLINETINIEPEITVSFEQEVYKESDSVLVVYSLNADDADGDNSELFVQQVFYADDPRTCRPICKPLTYQFEEYNGRYAVTLDVQLEQDVTDFWLYVVAQDFDIEKEEVFQFSVERLKEDDVDIQVEFEQSVIAYANEMNFAFDMQVGQGSVVTNRRMFLDDPNTCRPICEPIVVQWKNFESRNVGTFSLPTEQEEQTVWLSISAVKGDVEAEKHLPFTVTKAPNKAPSIQLTLEKTTLNESEGLVLPYNLKITDADTAESQLVLTHEIYDGDPRTCRPVCSAVAATFRQFENRHAAFLNVVLESDQTFWLLSSVSDGEYTEEAVGSFNVRKSIDNPPALSFRIDGSTIAENSGEVEFIYDVTASDPDNTTPVLQHFVYDENPTFCRPLCSPLAITLSNDDNRYGIRFNYLFTQTSTTFWLAVEASDGVNAVEKVSSFTVRSN